MDPRRSVVVNSKGYGRTIQFNKSFYRHQERVSQGTPQNNNRLRARSVTYPEKWRGEGKLSFIAVTCNGVKCLIYRT